LDARHDLARTARSDARNYWRDRADDVRYNVDNRTYNYFDDNWWEHSHWRHSPILVSDPWWWWRPAPWGAINAFFGTDWSEPIAYDYGSDVIWGPDEVYVHGEPVGTPATYAHRVIELANPPPIAEEPVAEENWRSLGVWALAQEDQGDAVMFFQLSVNREGIISGAYANALSGENRPVTGRVDKATQLAAWHIGDEKDKVFEAGLSNLTQDQASCLVHFGNGQVQNWLLVRLQNPTLPDQPTTLSQAENNEPASTQTVEK